MATTVERFLSNRDAWRFSSVTLNKTPDLEEQAKLLEIIQELIRSAAEDLEKSAQFDPHQGMVSVETARANSEGLTSRIKVDGDAVLAYVERMNQIRLVADYYNWAEGSYPLVAIDLTCVSVTTAVELILESGYLVFNMTSFQNDFTLTLDGTLEFDCKSSNFINFLVTIMSDCELILNIENCSFAEELYLFGDPQKSCKVSIMGGGPSTVHGPFSIKNCIARLTMPGWTLGSHAVFKNVATEYFNLNGVNFKDYSHFYKCSFEKNGAGFMNSVFEKPINFQECKFEKAPDFHGAKLHQHTKFEQCQFHAAGSILDASCTGIDVASYRVLKAHFGQQKDSRQETAFYALEQRGERFLSRGDSIEVGVSWIQDFVSGYGQSLSRSILVFVGWNAAFSLIYTHCGPFAIEVRTHGSINDFPAIALALQNAFNPLALFSDKGLVEIHSLWIYLASLVQTVGSLGIAALIFLTIRGKFRKGSASEG